jgi:hypothetical protein
MSTHREKLKHLLNGGKLKEEYGTKQLNHDGNLIWENNLESLVIDLENSEIYHEPKWYENIPEQGVLCWVSDIYMDTKKMIYLVNKYNEANEFKFSYGNASCWRYATPLTKAEALQYIMEPQK